MKDKGIGVAARHSSKTVEHFTPASVVERATYTLGGIDLDPASCAAANERVGATRFFTKEDNGFGRTWSGTVFLNPPGGRCDNLGRLVIPKVGIAPACTVSGSCGLEPGHQHVGSQSSAKAWWERLAIEWQVGNVVAAVFVAFSVEMQQTTQVKPGGHILLNFPICYPSRRLAYTREDGRVGKSPPHSSCIVLVSDDSSMLARFHESFSDLGRVVVPTTRATRE